MFTALGIFILTTVIEADSNMAVSRHSVSSLLLLRLERILYTCRYIKRSWNWRLIPSSSNKYLVVLSAFSPLVK